MDGIGTRSLGDIENLLYVEVRFPGGSRADRVSLIGFADVERGAVDGGVNGDGGDPHLMAGANYAYRNLPPIRDENLLEHRSPSATKASLSNQTEHCTGRAYPAVELRKKGIHHKRTRRRTKEIPALPSCNFVSFVVKDFCRRVETLSA